jgi:single-strand DNA-binding protein
MNKVILIGNLTKEVEVRYTQTNNTMVASFSIAVSRKFKKDGEQTADFINVVAWGKTAEFVSKYFSKGLKIAIVGRIQTRTYDDDKGVKHYITEVVAEEVEFVEKKKDKEEIEERETIKNEDSYKISSEDDLPF